MTCARRGKRSIRRGAAVVETAFIFSLFSLLLFGFFEHARIIYMRQLLQNAAREGARQALVNTGSKVTSDIQTVVTSYLANATLQNVNTQVYQADSNGNNIGSWNNTSFGNNVAVQIDADYRPLLPTMGLVTNPLHFQVKSFMLCEAN